MTEEQKPIPKGILEFAQHRASLSTFGANDDREELEARRNEALQAIQRYKRLRARIAEEADAKREILEWLKSVGTEI